MRALLILFLFSLSINAFSAQFYISNERVFSTTEEASFNYNNYSYRQGNNKEVHFSLYKIGDIKSFFESQAMQNYGSSLSDSTLKTFSLVKTWKFSPDQNYNQRVSLGQLPAGVYLVEGFAGTDVAQIPIIVSDYSVLVRNTSKQSVVYMSHRSTGKQEKAFKAVMKSGVDIKKPLYYKNATAIFDFSDGNSRNYQTPVMTYKGEKVAVTNTYFYNYYYGNIADKDLVSYLQTDRSGYRPGQTIKFKGILRKKDGFTYDIYTDSIVYVIQNKQQEEVAKKKVALDKNGSFNDSIVADPSWKLGDYTLKISSNTQNYYWYYNTQNNVCKFKVEEYKKPEYEVNVSIEESQYKSGDELKAKITADYFFGSPVTNAVVEYKIVQEHFYVPWYYNYRYWWWYEDLYGADYYTHGKKILYRGTGKLDAEGKLDIHYPTNANDKSNYKYTVIAEVRDASRRTITGMSTTIVSYTSYSISANLEKYYYHENENLRVNISTLDFSRKNVSKPVKITLTREPYYYYNRKTRDKSSITLDTIIQTALDGSISLELPQQKAGYYSIQLIGDPDTKNAVTSNIHAYVVDPKDNYAKWWGNSSGVQIMTDKKVYQAGETIKAMFFIPDTTDALVTLNGEVFAHFDSYTFLPNEGGSMRSIEIPLNEDINGKLELYVGYNKNNEYKSFKQTVAVIPNNKYLNVSLTFDEDEYRPGKKAQATLLVTDHLGKPVPNADVCLATADEAIYSLYPDLNKSIDKTFYDNAGMQYYYDNQNQFNISTYSRYTNLQSVEWRRLKYDLSIGELNLLDGSKWHKSKYINNTSGKPIIRGYVLDKKTGEPIPNASIVLNGKTLRANNNGYYALKGFQYNKTTIKFKAKGGQTSIENLTINKHNDIDLIVAIESGKTKSFSLGIEGDVLTLDDGEIVESAADADVVMAEESVALNSAAPANATGAVGGALAKKDASKGELARNKMKESNNRDENQKEDEALVDPEKIRSDFKDAIYWNPNARTNADGEAKITINLPDNLTTWRTTVKVITRDTKVGSTIAKIVVRKNLLVRMETPRFITLGDEMLIATTIHNYLDTEKKITVELESKGLVVDGTRQTLTIKPQDDKRVDWKINTKFITEAELTVKALSNEESDAMVIKVPVQPYGLELLKAKSLYVSNTERKSDFLTIPDDVDMNSASLEISTAPSVTAALLSSLDDLIGYPYGCVEQTMSRFLPNVIVAQTLQNLGSSYTSTIDAEELKKMVAKGTERLGQLQHNDGGWGWWENDATNGFMTAYVVNGLHMATEADYEIPANMLNQGKYALTNIIKNKKYDNNTTYAYAMMVAAKAGLKDLWKTKQMPDDANPYEIALWAQAAHYAKDTEMAKRMVIRLEDQVIKAGSAYYWGGKKFYYSWQDDKVETTANAILALSLINDKHPMIPGAVLWIMDQRKGNSWHNTRQTAMTIFGLSNLIKKDANPNLTVELKMNGIVLDVLNITNKNVFEKGKTYRLTAQELLTNNNNVKIDPLALLQRGDNKIEVVQKGNGTLFVNAKLKYFVSGESQIAKDEREQMPFIIDREYYRLKGVQKSGKFIYTKEKVDTKSIRSGDNILVKVKIKSKTAQEYVLVEDPIPAGCEFIRDPKGFVIQDESVYDGTGQYWNYRYWGYWNWNRWYSHREYRDNKLAHTITNLPGGTYEYSYLMKAQIPGKFKVNPVIAQLMYYPENRGFSEFGAFNIEAEKGDH